VLLFDSQMLGGSSVHPPNPTGFRSPPCGWRVAQVSRLRPGFGCKAELERFVSLNPAYGKHSIPSDEAAYCGGMPGIDLGIWADAGSPAEGDTAEHWTPELWNSLNGRHFGGYPSLLEPGDGTRIQAAYGSNYSRLRSLKAKFAPSNIFHSNVNISPA
jgi:hypothetical protein